MWNIIIKDLLPIIIIMVLGYYSGKKAYFTDEDSRAFNKLVLNYALPAALFVSIVKGSREMLFSDLKLFLISLVVIIGLQFWAYFSCQKFFHHTKAEAAISSLIGGAPTIGFLGFAVLEPIYGASTTVALVVAVVAIVVNAIAIPIALFLLNPGGSNGQKASHAEAFINAIKEPVVLAPIIAVVIVLAGVSFPSEFDPIFQLIAKANAGVAVFAAGLTLSYHAFTINKEVIYNSAVKLILMPLAMLVLGKVLGMEPDKLQMLVLCGALPPVFSGIIIGSRYQTYVQIGTSSLAVSTILFAVTAPFWIYVARIFC